MLEGHPKGPVESVESPMWIHTAMLATQKSRASPVVNVSLVSLVTGFEPLVARMS